MRSQIESTFDGLRCFHNRNIIMASIHAMLLHLVLLHVVLLHLVQMLLHCASYFYSHCRSFPD